MTPTKKKKPCDPLNHKVSNGGGHGTRTQCTHISTYTLLYSISEFSMYSSIYNISEFEIVTPKWHHKLPDYYKQ